MIDAGKFKPKTVYVIYTASTAEKVWQALTAPELVIKLESPKGMMDVVRGLAATKPWLEG